MLIEVPDIGLLIFNVVQYIVIMFVCYCAFRGFICFLSDIKSHSFSQIDKKIEYWEKKKELERAKLDYEIYVEEINHPENIYTIEEDDEPQIDETEEIDIPSLDSLIKEDPNFLQHSEDACYVEPPVEEEKKEIVKSKRPFFRFRFRM